jgi:hypothetical protein
MPRHPWWSLPELTTRHRLSRLETKLRSIVGFRCNLVSARSVVPARGGTPVWPSTAVAGHAGRRTTDAVAETQQLLTLKAPAAVLSPDPTPTETAADARSGPGGG